MGNQLPDYVTCDLCAAMEWLTAMCSHIPNRG